ncbi:MAG TPA: CopG family transcriptional regulator [Candidatus Nanoarchaeia archaeon]|nr:CopG family transcriptional regulator [Candidatus Nanoarchaeia archaeon]
MVNKELVNFIKEARKRGFDDYQIRKPLLDNNWPIHEIEKAFASLSPKTHLKYKNKVTIYLDSSVLKVLEKRADKSLMTLSEMIEDILRRSAINSKKIKKSEEKLDDMFISLFSRKTPGKPRKS